LFILGQASLIASVAEESQIGFAPKTLPNEALPMSTEFNELLSFLHGDPAQILIIGTREQVLHLINEFCVKRIARDRAQFMPIVPLVSVPGRFMTILER
jgi:hypothetical protein